ncbi:ABC transporter substrate-binding protein [Sulfurospirillum arcachonense]|uniref:ABC transporter substrate-binding protein n=1 Tax=Sulfurospirillum arcachonense TaxID=57666 RepID=UPI000469142A|nr:ABC transporter substrate-binding protein [Sulfurospirillum arcachonense]
MKFLKIFCLFVIFLSSALFAKEKVVLISVATPTDIFWQGIHSIAKSAGKSLNMDFEIIYTNRDSIRAVNVAEEIANKKDKPDYVIVIGEKLIASRSIPILAQSGIKVFMFGKLKKEEKALIGEPREKYPNYIGKISINDYMAGYLTAKLMIKKAIKNKIYDKDGYINLIAFEGERKTSFSSERVRGLNDAVKEYSKVRILQSIPTNWTASYVNYALPKLIKRYSKYKICGIWGANSELARASSQLLIKRGKIPNIDFVTAGTDWSKDALTSVDQGMVLGIAGGHMASVAWILTLIHDYHNGIDFDSTVYLNKVTVIEKKSAKKFLKYFNENNWESIDFKTFSKKENPNIKEYNLSFEAILNSL